MPEENEPKLAAVNVTLEQAILGINICEQMAIEFQEQARNENAPVQVRDTYYVLSGCCDDIKKKFEEARNIL